MRCYAKLPPEEFITMRFRANSCSVNDWICRRDNANNEGGGLVADSDDKEINCFIHANKHIKNISYGLEVAGIIPLALH